mmetsp:Transcript_12319/g.26918  ORF Transcript_12319/g.26918 Transcript_12319/m.26918 type:complete len:204 (+) Transcript_12319:971-1582(+)
MLRLEVVRSVVVLALISCQIGRRERLWRVMAADHPRRERWTRCHELSCPRFLSPSSPRNSTEVMKYLHRTQRTTKRCLPRMDHSFLRLKTWVKSTRASINLSFQLLSVTSRRVQSATKEWIWCSVVDAHEGIMLSVLLAMALLAKSPSRGLVIVARQIRKLDLMMSCLVLILLTLRSRLHISTWRNMLTMLSCCKHCWRLSTS